VGIAEVIGLGRRKMTARQRRACYATGGFKRKPRPK